MAATQSSVAPCPPCVGRLFHGVFDSVANAFTGALIERIIDPFTSFFSGTFSLRTTWESESGQEGTNDTEQERCIFHNDEWVGLGGGCGVSEKQPTPLDFGAPT